jgi:hypothetical protein
MIAGHIGAHAAVPPMPANVQTDFAAWDPMASPTPPQSVQKWNLQVWSQIKIFAAAAIAMANDVKDYGVLNMPAPQALPGIAGSLGGPNGKLLAAILSALTPNLSGLASGTVPVATAISAIQAALTAALAAANPPAAAPVVPVIPAPGS